MQGNTPQSSKKSNPKGLLITLIVLLIIIIVGGAIWLYLVYSKASDVEKDLATDELPKVEEILPEPQPDEAIDSPIIEPEDQPDEPEEPAEPKEIDYYSRKYGFGFTFPATWEGYIVNEQDTKWADFTAKSLYFGFPVQKDGLFAVTVFTKAQWDKLKSLPPEERRTTYLGENSQYVFTWSHSQHLANTEMEKRAQEVPQIIKSFHTDAK